MNLIDFGNASVIGYHTAVTDLSSAFGIETSRIKNDASFIADFIDKFSVFEQRNNFSFTRKIIISDKNGRLFKIHQIRSLASH